MSGTITIIEANVLTYPPTKNSVDKVEIILYNK